MEPEIKEDSNQNSRNIGQVDYFELLSEMRFQ